MKTLLTVILIALPLHVGAHVNKQQLDCQLYAEQSLIRNDQHPKEKLANLKKQASQYQKTCINTLKKYRKTYTEEQLASR